jgi:hypothetical protein
MKLSFCMSVRSSPLGQNILSHTSCSCYLHKKDMQYNYIRVNEKFEVMLKDAFGTEKGPKCIRVRGPESTGDPWVGYLVFL